MKDIKFRFWLEKEKKMCSWEVIKKECNRLSILEMKGFIPLQFTGLLDKSGKEIYEGDVVNITIRENIGTFNVPDDIIANGGYTGRDDVYEGEVIFKDFGFCINDKKMGEFYLQPMEDTFFEILGNIHENPELLKERR